MTKWTRLYTPDHIIWKLYFLVALLCLFALPPARAGEGQDAAPHRDSTTNPDARVCLDPASGEQSRIDLGGSCPEGDTAFISYEASPRAEPLSFEPQQEQQEDAEVGDAPMDRQ